MGNRKAKKPKSQATAAPVPAKPVRTKLWQWTLLASGWVVSLFLGLLDLPEKIVSFAESGPKAKEYAAGWFWNYQTFTGRFSSDPAA